jgi:hypothetical protein
MKFMQSLLALKEAEQTAKNTVELTALPEKLSHDELSNAWPDGVMYRGQNVFKVVYDNRPEELKDAEQRLKDNFDGDLDMQESYLGYSPSKDLFVQGYDGWYTQDNPSYDEDDEDSGDEKEDGNCSPYFFFTISDDGVTKVGKMGDDMSGNGEMWYGNHGGHQAAEKMFPDLIDIRLD